MRRTSDTRFFLVLVVLSLLIRTSASLGQSVVRFPDSPGYENLTLWGDVDRFWPVPLVYSIFFNDTARIVSHIAIGIAAWTWLAIVVSRLCRWPKISFFLVITLGLSPQVIRYDIALLSESLGISFAICALAATLQRRISTNLVTDFVWLMSIAFCAMTRPAHLLILLVAFLPTVGTFLKTRSRGSAIVAGALTALSVIGFMQLQGHKSTSTLNFYTVLAERVITDDERYNWFVTHGMPDVAGARDAFGYDYSFQLPTDVADIVNLPTGQSPPTLMRVGGVPLAQWVSSDGWSTYARYIITHPVDTIIRITSLLDSTLTPTSGDFLPVNNGPMLPWGFFLGWELWLLLLVGSTTWLYLKSSTRQHGHLMLAISAILIALYSATVLTSGIEHPRHMVTVAVMLRVCALTSILLALTTAVSSRKGVAPVYAQN